MDYFEYNSTRASRQGYRPTHGLGTPSDAIARQRAREARLAVLDSLALEQQIWLAIQRNKSGVR